MKWEIEIKKKHVPLPTVVKELLNYTGTFQGMPIEPYLVGGFNPIWKILVKLEIFPK